MLNSKALNLFKKLYSSIHYDIEIDNETLEILTISIGKIYNSCEYDELDDTITDVIAKFNTKYLGKTYATTSLLSGDKFMYVSFMEYKNIPESENCYLEYAYERSGDKVGFPKMRYEVYKKLLELKLR